VVAIVADPYLERAVDHVDRLVLEVVHVKRRPAVRGDLDDEVLEQPVCLVARQLEDQIAARPGLQTP
jgi:hypothetical protein